MLNIFPSYFVCSDFSSIIIHFRLGKCADSINKEFHNQCDLLAFDWMCGWFWCLRTACSCFLQGSWGRFSCFFSRVLLYARYMQQALAALCVFFLTQNTSLATEYDERNLTRNEWWGSVECAMALTTYWFEYVLCFLCMGFDTCFCDLEMNLAYTLVLLGKCLKKPLLGVILIFAIAIFWARWTCFSRQCCFSMRSKSVGISVLWVNLSVVWLRRDRFFGLLRVAVLSCFLDHTASMLLFLLLLLLLPSTRHFY